MEGIGNTPLIKLKHLTDSNVWAALQRAKIIGKGKTIVALICDSGLK